MLKIFEFQDVAATPIHAFVLAVDIDRANELFTIHLQEHGGDPDSLIFRELTLDHLQDAASAAIRQALDFGVDGLVLYGEQDRWFFVTPLGSAADRIPASS